jgi:hypothetical protein
MNYPSIEHTTVKIKFKAVFVYNFPPKNNKFDQELLTKNIKKRFIYKTSRYKFGRFTVSVLMSSLLILKFNTPNVQLTHNKIVTYLSTSLKILLKIKS